jgi:hypothetical protein
MPVANHHDVIKCANLHEATRPSRQRAVPEINVMAKKPEINVMAKKIVYGDEARRAVLRGIDQLADAVKVTLGPRGRNVIIGKHFGSPTITKNGVTVAKEIDLKDPLENMGAQMAREFASKIPEEKKQAGAPGPGGMGGMD